MPAAAAVAKSPIDADARFSFASTTVTTGSNIDQSSSMTHLVETLADAKRRLQCWESGWKTVVDSAYFLSEQFSASVVDSVRHSYLLDTGSSDFDEIPLSPIRCTPQGTGERGKGDEAVGGVGIEAIARATATLHTALNECASEQQLVAGTCRWANNSSVNSALAQY